MGTPVREIEPGVNCGHWDPPAETPVALYCFFWDVLKGDRGGAREPPNGHLFKLDQMVPDPCAWKFVSLTFGWEVTFFLQAGAMGVQLQDAIFRNNTYFVDNKVYPPLNEYELFTNELVGAAGNWGYNGHSTIFWMPDIIALAAAFGLDHVDDLMLEIFPVSDTELVIKLCSLTLRTNISIKISV